MAEITEHDFSSRLLEALPELEPPLRRCFEEEGGEDGHSGLIILAEDTLGRLIEILVCCPAGARRDDMLRRALGFIESMLERGDESVRGAAGLLLESPWWLPRVRDRLGPLSRDAAGLDNLPGCLPAWRNPFRSRDRIPDSDREILDLYGVREEVVRALGEETDAGLAPGVSGLSEWLRLRDLDSARTVAHGVMVISHYGTSVPCIVAPAATVMCTEEVLAGVADQMSGYVRGEPRRQRAEVGYFRIEPGTPIWNLSRGRRRHARYEPKLWVRKHLEPFRAQIEQVLRGERPHLDCGTDAGVGTSPGWPAMIHEPAEGDLTYVDDGKHWRWDLDLSVWGDWGRQARLVDSAGRVYRLEAPATGEAYVIRATDGRVSADEVREMMEEFLTRCGSPERDIEAYRRGVEGLGGEDLIRWTICHLGVFTGVSG